MTILDAILQPGEAFQGACAKVDPDMFNEPGARNIRAAKFVCSQCPIRAACLNAAMTAEAGVKASVRRGIYGGLTAPERDELDKSRNPGRETVKRNPAYRVTRSLAS